jgi:hypothetical protein
MVEDIKQLVEYLEKQVHGVQAAFMKYDLRQQQIAKALQNPFLEWAQQRAALKTPWEKFVAEVGELPCAETGKKDVRCGNCVVCRAQKSAKYLA